MLTYSEVVPSRWGNFIALRCDPYQYQSLCLYGEWAHDETEICLSLIKPGDVVLDVGAHIGTMTIPFAQRVGQQGTVLCFEPQRLPYLALCGNLVLNSVAEWSRPALMALGDYDGEITVPSVDPRKPNNFGGVRCDDSKLDHMLNTSGPRMPVRISKLDTLALPRVDFIKIDVECMESKVLRGGAETIKRCRPLIWAEALNFEAKNRAEMAEFFNANDYKAWEFITPVYSPRNTRGSQYNPYAQQCDMNVLAVHASQEPPEVTKHVLEFKPQ